MSEQGKILYNKICFLKERPRSMELAVSIRERTSTIIEFSGISEEHFVQKDRVIVSRRQIASDKAYTRCKSSIHAVSLVKR